MDERLVDEREVLATVRDIPLTGEDIDLLCRVAAAIRGDVTLDIYLAEVGDAVADAAEADEDDEDDEDTEAAARMLLECSELLAESEPEIAAGLARAARERLP